MGQPASRAEGELREITRANGVVWREQLEARQATVKRRREETAAHTEQCLCTREGAITMLKQSMKLNHQLNEQADELLKIAKIPISAPSEPAVAQCTVWIQTVPSPRLPAARLLSLILEAIVAAMAAEPWRPQHWHPLAVHPRS